MLDVALEDLSVEVLEIMKQADRNAVFDVPESIRSEFDGLVEDWDFYLLPTGWTHSVKFNDDGLCLNDQLDRLLDKKTPA